MKQRCEEVCVDADSCDGIDCVPICEEVCTDPYEECTFQVGRDEISSELGYFTFKGKGDEYCGKGETNPVLGIKKGATYLFTQRRTGNYYHPLGFAYGADGALDDQPELEPGICPGTKKGEEDSTECACQGAQVCDFVCSEPGTTDIVKINDFATVVAPDVMATNGVIHVINSVLVPPSIDVTAFLATCPEPIVDVTRALGEVSYDLTDGSGYGGYGDSPPPPPPPPTGDLKDIVATAIDAGIFTTLVAALEAAAELVITLQEPGPFTVFAPTDEAFDALPNGLVSCLLLPENLEALFSILSYHVVVDEAVLSSALSMGQQIPTAQGENIIITITNAEPICEEVCTYPDALCPAPMYYSSDNYLGEYSNNPSLGPVTPSDDFGLDAYEPQFFYPLLRWKGTPKEEDPEGPGYYQAALHIPVDEEFMGDFFYFCHIHQYMTGRFKFVDEEGFSISPINTPRIPYEYQEPDAYDRSCGATGISDSQLPDNECPSTFVCDAPNPITKPFAAKFAQCVDSMNCAMLKGITTKIQSDSVVALFNHQMIPHHQQAVNMCKALDIAKGTECDDIFNEDDPQCVLKVLCQEIINVQNAQIQTMRGVLASLDYKETDNCVVEIPVDPETACLEESDSTGYIWCTLTQTCVAPGDDACLKANCEKNSSSTGYKWCPETRTCDAPDSDACEIAACPGPWCAILRTCDPPGDACEKATCEQNSGSNGFSWCAATQTCVAPGDDSCLIANCEQDSGSTGYKWCTVTRTCDAPGSDACEKAECEKNTGSDGYKWCGLLQTCVAPSDTSCDQAECESTSGSTGYVWCTSVQECIPFAECDPTPSPTSRPTKSSKSSKSRRRN